MGDDPDEGTCDSVVAYHYDQGQISGMDVSGLTLALVCHIPGNVLQGNWQVAVHVDSRATPEQKEAILAAHTGKAASFRVNLPQHQMTWEFNGRNAILGDFRFEA